MTTSNNMKTSFKISIGFILGLFEADGSLLISISKKADNLNGHRIRLAFIIALHEKDIAVLYAIQAYLGVGRVEVANKYATGTVYRFIVSNHTHLSGLVRQTLSSQPMVLAKRSHDLTLFLAALDIMEMKLHTTMEGLTSIQLLASQLSGKMSKEEKSLLVHPRSPITPEWFQGFTMGEGSFYAQVTSNATSTLGYRVIVAFDISQELSELLVVVALQEFLGCGTVVGQNRHPSLRVQSRAHLISHVIPFFESYPLLGSKLHRLNLVKEIIGILEVNKPLTIGKLDLIRELISQLSDTNY